jgi:V/A-type H+/Na+-transporting ATPase subunit D
MPLRVPPGKAGRLWLVRRLGVAERGRDLLDRKRQALLAHERRLRAEADASRERLEAAAADAERWMPRAVLAEGESRIGLFAAHVREPADARIDRRRLMGVRIPALAAYRAAPVPDLAGLGAQTALLRAADAYRRLAAVAVEAAVARAAADRVSSELATVARRQRALEQRWIPRQRAALAALELTLEESEREEAARIRWLAERHGERSAEPA